MSLLQITMMPKTSLFLYPANFKPDFPCFLSSSNQYPHSNLILSTSHCWNCVLPPYLRCRRILKSFRCYAVLRKPDSEPNPESGTKPKTKPKTKHSPKNAKDSQKLDENPERISPTTIPRKPRRGRKSEAAKVEDFVRDKLEQTFAAIQQQSPVGLESMESVMNEKVEEVVDSESSDDDEIEDEDDEDEDDDVGRVKGKRKKMVVDEESKNWPLDADVGWGIRASEYFEKHAIKNVVGEDGSEIDWEGEIDDSWVKEINCLEWESFAFHPSPLIVLVFERYNRATVNWRTLKELEKAAKVYWSAKDRLPPRTVKIDINIEKDLAYALKVKEGPQILFLLGNRILYREKEFRTADELVHMIAYFYYNARKPSCIKDAAVS